ncbi:Calcium load-activated calcium channel like [Actinidia chinensis var. chinensis]|uniref:Calcium load-activated calcium channel like n=1 Tax=Actinidia chinensis var. chinensis TaxID=1590841 RepID=A0A2R6S1Y8_ACTCC|nr:Calcium load-activated calcium channel like [Actinidia chinensis var. chinensis]
MEKKPARRRLWGARTPKNFCKLVQIRIEPKKYRNANEQSVGSSPCRVAHLLYDSGQSKRKLGDGLALEERFEEAEDDEEGEGDDVAGLELEEIDVAAGLLEAALSLRRSIFLALALGFLLMEESVFMVSTLQLLGGDIGGEEKKGIYSDL